MAKEKKSFVCSECGSEHTRWQGRCSDCNEWNTIVEMKISPVNPKNKVESAVRNFDNLGWADGIGECNRLSDIRKSGKDEGEALRYDTGKNEFNSVLGGGI
jgi:DNA repair protein RadA/Sms